MCERVGVELHGLDELRSGVGSGVGGGGGGGGGGGVGGGGDGDGDTMTPEREFYSRGWQAGPGTHQRCRGPWRAQ